MKNNTDSIMRKFSQHEKIRLLFKECGYDMEKEREKIIIEP